MTNSTWETIPGGQSLIEWLGRAPRFHDAEVLDISISAKTLSFIRIHTWNMTDKVDDRGYFVTERHAVVTISLNEVTSIALNGFDVMPGIIFDLEVSSIEDGFPVAWSGSYGVAGILRAKRISVDFEPEKFNSSRELIAP
jgi:Immunity protein 50